MSFLFPKTRLGNPEVRKLVDQFIQEYLTEYLELHPDVLDSILSKSLNALKVHCYSDDFTLLRITYGYIGVNFVNQISIV